jgi:ribosome biogenesis ATPase
MCPGPETSFSFGQRTLTDEELQALAITMADFEAAVLKVQPSIRREGFTTTPDVTWDDVGSLSEVRTQSLAVLHLLNWLWGFGSDIHPPSPQIREELSFAITRPIANPEIFEAMGLQTATGVLLFGPPGEQGHALRA